MRGHIAALNRAAAAFKAQPPCPRLWLFTDPIRLPDPDSAAAALPPGSAVVYRHFGAATRLWTAQRLAALCRQRRLRLLIGADADLARQVDADGVHLPSRLAHFAGQLRKRFPTFYVSIAVHEPRTLANLGATRIDAVVCSPLFPTRSAAGRAVIAPRHWRRDVHHCGVPAVALGGISLTQAPMLAACGFSGIAGIDLFRPNDASEAER